MKHPLTFCISTYNNLEYLKIAITSVRRNSYFNDAPFIIHAENCTDKTNEWLEKHSKEYNLQYYIENNEVPLGIGGGMNFCANKVETEYINFLHSDFYVSKDWDLVLYNIHNQYPNKKLWVNSFRVEPNIFRSKQRPGTLLVDTNVFGEYWYNFNSELFDRWSLIFSYNNYSSSIPKGEGVSGLIKKSVWDEIGGNDPMFAPTSWDDMDLFLRMKNCGIEFVLPYNSVVWHFGARGSHRLEENDGKSSTRQLLAEHDNAVKFIKKWGGVPSFDRYGMIQGIEGICRE